MAPAALCKNAQPCQVRGGARSSKDAADCRRPDPEPRFAASRWGPCNREPVAARLHSLAEEHAARQAHGRLAPVGGGHGKTPGYQTALPADLDESLSRPTPFRGGIAGSHLVAARIGGASDPPRPAARGR